MTHQEIKIQEERVKKYRELQALRCETQQALDLMDHKGRFHAPPFTGNTRESRRVQHLKITFTKTLGGEEALELELRDLYVSAWLFGDHLKQQLRERIAQIDKEMEAI